MVNLRLLEDEVRTERNVVLEERRSSVDGNPLSLLSEQMLASLYQNHPYHRPALGWEHEVTELSLKDASAFYKRFYAPNNAVLVVAGDVTPEEVRPLAEATYGRNRANKAVGRATRLKEPPAVSARRVRLEDARTGAPLLLRYYLVPTYTSGKPGEAESLELLSWIIGGDDTSRMYRRLVDTNAAATAGTNYESTILDRGRLAVVVLPIPGGSMEKAEAEIDAIIAEVRDKGVTQEELDKAKFALEAQRVFDLDNQSTLANRYGQAIALGRTVADIEALPARMQAITVDDIKRVAAAHLVPQLSVTGVLVPPPAPPPPPQAQSPKAAKK
jgi:zinc protease